MRCLWDVSKRSPLRETSQRPLRNISKETSQIHLKKDGFFETFLRRLKYISKKMSFCDVSKTSQIYIKKDVIFVTWPFYHVSNTSHKRCFSGDVFKASQTYLKKMFVLWRLWYVPKIYLSICDYSKIHAKMVSCW